MDSPDKREFLALIERDDPTEEDVHQFLVARPHLLPCFLAPFRAAHTHFQNNKVFSKLPLGSQHVVDFAWVTGSTEGFRWCLLELEHPHDRLFTKSGDTTAKLNHGLRQLRDWQTWFLRNRQYVTEHLPFHVADISPLATYPSLVLGIGRRHTLNNHDKAQLERLNDNSSRIHIMTFDRLADHADYPAYNSTSIETCAFRDGSIIAIAPGSGG